MPPSASPMKQPVEPGTAQPTFDRLVGQGTSLQPAAEDRLVTKHLGFGQGEATTAALDRGRGIRYVGPDRFLHWWMSSLTSASLTGLHR